jgi:CheY-like chemotaxis protein
LSALQLSVPDSFDPAKEQDRSSLGHASMRQRASFGGGELHIDRTPDCGTTIQAWAPPHREVDRECPRVLLADDHCKVVEGVKALDEFELLDVVEGGRAMIAAAEKLRPDVIVADIAMPNLSGFEALARLRKSHPAIKAFFLTMHQRMRRTRASHWKPALPHSSSSMRLPRNRCWLSAQP